MIYQTILAGLTVPGSNIKRVIHPYTQESSDSIAYANQLIIPPFEISDRTTTREKIISAASDFAAYFQTQSDEVLLRVAAETGSPLRYHQEDTKKVCNFLMHLDKGDQFLPKTFLHEPKGNVLIVLPANEPITISTTLLFTALYMGNTVYLKPSSKTPSFSYFLLKFLTEIPILKDRIHYLLCEWEETQRLISNRSFDAVMTMGSRTANKSVAATCANAEVECITESEGNDWAYVGKDCTSIEQTATMLAESVTKHNAQMCNAPRGILVQNAAYKPLVYALKERLQNLRVSNPQQSDADLGSLLEGTLSGVQAAFEAIAAQCEERWQFPSTNPTLFPSALALGPSETAPILSEPIFGPLVWIKKVAGAEEAIDVYKRFNKHGFAFSVFSDNQKEVQSFTERLQVGRININAHPLSISPFDPVGGIRLSGHQGPAFWCEKFARRKYVAST